MLSWASHTWVSDTLVSGHPVSGHLVSDNLVPYDLVPYNLVPYNLGIYRTSASLQPQKLGHPPVERTCGGRPRPNLGRGSSLRGAALLLGERVQHTDQIAQRRRDR